MTDFAWAPDSRALAIAAVNGDPGNLESIDQSVVRLHDVLTGRNREIYRSSENLDALSWTSEGIILARGQSPLKPQGTPGLLGEVSLLDPSNGRLTSLAADSNYFPATLAPAPSPDGGTIVFGHNPMPEALPTVGFMVPAIYDMDNGNTRVLTPANGYALMSGPLRWREGSRSVVSRCKTGALFSSLCMIDTTTNTLRRLDIDQFRDIAVFAVSRSNGRIALLSEDTVGRIRLTVTDKNLDQTRDIYRVNRFDLAGVALGELRTVSWSTSDGLDFTGLLVLPVNYEPGKRYPIIIDIHGGPYGGIKLSGALLSKHALEWQMWAAKGYAVLVADYRKGGVAGLNPDFHRRTRGYLEDDDVADVVAALDTVIEMGIADPRRVVAIGHSYGGWVLDWWLTRSSSDKLTAAIVHEGAPILYWEGYEKNSQKALGPWHAYMRWFLGTDEANRRRVARENSPISYADRIRTPVLWLSGARRSSGGSAKNPPQLYVEAINSHGGCARLLEFPEEGHVFSKTENVRETLALAIEWTKHWFSGSTSCKHRSAEVFP